MKTSFNQVYPIKGYSYSYSFIFLFIQKMRLISGYNVLFMESLITS